MRQYKLDPPPDDPNALTDESPMPFGKHTGIRMGDVPGSYFAWLWGNGMARQTTSPVHKYIVKNIENIESDAPDAIFEPDPRKLRPK